MNDQVFNNLFTRALFFALGISILAPHSSEAANLGAPIDLENAAVLPKGIRNIRLKGVGTDIEEKYNNQGKVVGLGDDMNSPLTLQRVYEGTQDDQKASDTLALAQNNGISLSDSLGTTTGVVNASASVTVPVFAYGVTEKLTTAFALPIVKVKTSIATGYVSSENMALLRSKLVEQGRDDLLAEFDSKTQNPILYKINEYSYDPLANSDETKIGDLKWVNKYRALEVGNFALALKAEVVMPTGEEKNVNKVVDVPSGDGQWDLGAGINADYVFARDFTWSSALAYTWQSSFSFGKRGKRADEIEVRLPRFDYSSLSPDKDMVRRDLGDILFAQTGLKYDFLGGFSILGAYSIQYKERDRYRSLTSLYPDQAGRYSLLSKNTRQRMQSITLGGGYSTISLFREKKFAVPLQANVSWARPIEGKNVNKDALAQGELVLFF